MEWISFWSTAVNETWSNNRFVLSGREVHAMKTDRCKRAYWSLFPLRSPNSHLIMTEISPDNRKYSILIKRTISPTINWKDVWTDVDIHLQLQFWQFGKIETRWKQIFSEVTYPTHQRTTISLVVWVPAFHDKALRVFFCFKDMHWREIVNSKLTLGAVGCSSPVTLSAGEVVV